MSPRGGKYESDARQTTMLILNHLGNVNTDIPGDGSRPAAPSPASHATTSRDERTHLAVHENTASEVRSMRNALGEANPDMKLNTDDIVRLTFMLSGRLAELDALEDSGLTEQELEVLGTFAEAIEKHADPEVLGAVDRAEAPDGGDSQ